MKLISFGWSVPFVSKFLYAGSLTDCRVQTPELAMWLRVYGLSPQCFCFLLFKIELIM